MSYTAEDLAATEALALDADTMLSPRRGVASRPSVVHQFLATAHAIGQRTATQAAIDQRTATQAAIDRRARMMGLLP